jgi:hypothetical protein
MAPAPVQLGLPLDRSWYDPLLIYRLNQFTVTPVTIGSFKAVKVANADPNRWSIGFGQLVPSTGSYSPMLISVGGWNPNVGGFQAPDPIPIFFNMQQHGLVPQQEFWIFLQLGATVQVYTTSRY